MNSDIAPAGEVLPGWHVQVNGAVRQVIATVETEENGASYQWVYLSGLGPVRYPWDAPLQIVDQGDE